MREWAEKLQVPFLSALRETQLYVKCLEIGQTLFDLPASATKVNMAQWEPILDWLRSIAKLKPIAVTAPAFAIDTVIEDPITNLIDVIGVTSVPLPDPMSSDGHLHKTEVIGRTSNPTDDHNTPPPAEEIQAAIPTFLLRQR
ncbi:hypothetical protein [Undibacterium sp.]|uniref:hypothetical protein n=1 Tax=Undibacterium sp. TaxID=1914977 RepID=UPI0025F5046C|nr:hypothetical protein [Undibacterium sp.]